MNELMFDQKSRLPAWIAGLLLCWVRPWRGRLDPEPKKLLIVRPDRRVGNQIISSSLVVALSTHRPEIEVHYLAPEGKTALLDGLPGLAKVHALPRHPMRNLAALWRLLKALRSERFDVAIDASHWHSFSLTAALLTRCCGARWTIGHRRPGAAGLLNEWVAAPTGPDWPAELEVKARLLEPLGVDVKTPQMALPLPDDADDVVRWWAAHATQPHRLVLWPTTRKSVTEVPAGLWPHVLQRLPLPHDLSIAVGWGPGEEALAEQLVASLQGEGFEAVQLPATSISELGMFMREADMVVSGDTGPLHLAGAVARRVIGVFRRPDGKRWLPLGSAHSGYLLSDLGDLEEMDR